MRRRGEGVRVDVLPVTVHAESCPAEVCVSEQSQNAGELQSLVSLDYKYHFFFSSNISKYKPAILRSWSLKTFFFF